MKHVLLSTAASVALALSTHAQSANNYFYHVPFANRHLSNLRSPTAVNIDLRPARNNAKNLGSSSKAWKNLYLSGSVYKGSSRFLSSDTSGNTFLGILAGRINTGTNNTALGENAMYNATTGSLNTATGYQALYSNTEGESNAAFGFESLLSNTTGFFNAAFGRGSMHNNTTGAFNTATGLGALFNNTEGFANVASGAFALVRNITGSGNTGIGQSALWTNETNSNNTALGNEAAGNSFDYSNATFLGVQTNADSGLTNVTAIGFQAHATSSNQVMIGNTSVTSIGGYANWSNFSDGRYKKNVKENVPGLTFITQLRPVTYTLDVAGITRTTAVQRESTVNMPGLNDRISMPVAAYNKSEKQQAEELKARGEKAKVVHTGFIAQEVQQAAKKLNYDFSGVDVPKSEKNFYALRYGDFVVPLVKAVQELNKKIEEIDLLKAEIKEQQQEIDELKNAVNKLIKDQPITTNRNRLSGAYLQQNTPNPSNGSTSIRYHISSNSGNAKVVITDNKGSIVKTIALGNKESGQITLSKGILAAGSYNYTLYVNGTQTDSKQMTLIK